MARIEPRVTVTEVIKDFPTLLSVDGSTNIGCVIVSEVGPKLAYVDGPNRFLQLFTKDGQTIPRNAHISFINAYYLSFVASMVVARSMNSDVKGAVKIYADANNALTAVPTLYNGETELNRKTTWNLEFTANQENRGIVFQNTLYYTGDVAAVKAGLAAKSSGWELGVLDGMNAVSIDDFGSGKDEVLDMLASLLTTDGTFIADYNATTDIMSLYFDEYTDPYSPKDGQTTPTKTLVDVDLFNITLAEGDTNATVTDLATNSGDKLFIVISKTAGNVGSNPYTIKVEATQIGAGNHKVFNLILNGETYLVSLDPEATDNSGMNCYIEVLNGYSTLNFTVKAIEHPNLTFTAMATAANFGEGLNDVNKATKITNLKSALDTLDDQEMYKIHGLATMGITNVQFVKTYCSLGSKRKWFCPWDVPYDRENYNSISAYGANMEDSYNNYGMGPFDKNTGLTGWLNYIAGTTLYWERVMRNKAMRSEFAPVFDAETGILAYTNPTKLLTKSVREKLLSIQCPINWVIFNQNTMSYYMNDNFTHYSQNNILNEECNVRMTHKISNDLQDLMGQFKAKYNNEQTRQNVYDLIQLYFQQNIMNQNFRPEEFMIICDRTNNTDDIIQSSKLAVTVKIRLYHSVKYIEVLNEVYSVGGAAFTA